MGRRRPKIARTPGDLARLCGVGRATAYRWIKAGCPRLADESFDVAAVQAWAKAMRHDAHVRGASGEPKEAAPNDAGEMPAGDAPSASSHYIDREQHDARYRKARADRAEMENARLRGELVPRPDVADLLRAHSLVFRRHFDAMRRRLPTRLVGLTDPREIDLVLGEEFNALLTQAYGEGGGGDVAHTG